MTLEEQIAVMQHYANGGKVELLDKNYNEGWQPTTQPAWNWADFGYRIKKEPRELMVWAKGLNLINAAEYVGPRTHDQWIKDGWELITLVEKL